MILTGENLSTRRENCPDATLFTTNFVWIGPGTNSCLRSQEPTISICIYIHIYSIYIVYGPIHIHLFHTLQTTKSVSTTKTVCFKMLYMTWSVFIVWIIRNTITLRQNAGFIYITESCRHNYQLVLNGSKQKKFLLEFCFQNSLFREEGICFLTTNRNFSRNLRHHLNEIKILLPLPQYHTFRIFQISKD
jgi:hypothetical protein